MRIATPYLLFLGDAHDDLAAKTAHGIADWRPDACIGQYRLPGCQADTGLPDIAPADAARMGARTMIIGAVNPGGTIPDSWIGTLVEALACGLDLASGMHGRLRDIRAVGGAAEQYHRTLHDVRLSTERFDTGKGVPRPGKRLLTVGTDCSVGKKYTALALEREMRLRNMDVDFRATGQTGILISGTGVAIDAVAADFISGAAEWLTPDAAPDHWDVVEGQGALFHPSFAGVTLGLLHGVQPDAFVLCHEPTRKSMRNVATPMPDLGDCIDLTIRLGRMTNPAIRCAGIAVDTSRLTHPEADELLHALSDQHGLPCVDPLVTGVGAIVDTLLASR